MPDRALRSVRGDCRGIVDEGNQVVDKRNNPAGTMSVKSKVWIEIDGEPFLGEGRRNLLQRIQEIGSISQSARELGISYKKAWSYIKHMERRLGIRLVEKQVGGKGGGGSVLTDEGRALIDKYDRLLAGNQETVNKCFEEIFGAP